MREFIKKPSLTQAWVAIGLWVLVYGVLKFFSTEGLDIDSAEQVYFAQSWQMGYGTRQPPLYTWLLLWLKPAQASWVTTLEVARYACLVLWLGGVQALAAACGADRRTQARVLLAHLGLMLAMWRVHDSLTHTVLAAGITVWGSAALIRALTRPAWWLVVGGVAALACLSKLNAALWCLASLVAAWVVIWQSARAPQAPGGVASPGAHAVWMAGGLLVFVAILMPYAQWWLTQPSGSVALARRIVLSDDHIPMWKPLLRVTGGALEYVLVTPLILVLMAWRRRAGTAVPLVPVSLGGRWLVWQTVLGMLMLAGVMVAMKASHFTPRWLWPVMPGLTVWLCVRACQVIDGSDAAAARWQQRAGWLIWLMVLTSMAMALARVWVPQANAQRCTNCWTDRPAAQMSADLHARYGQQGLRIIAGDDHLAGILAEVNEADSAWTASSADLPAPADFIRDRGPCVVAWVSMEGPTSLPGNLHHVVGEAVAQSSVAHTSWPMRLAPQRHIWLSSLRVTNSVCDKARR